MISRSTDCHHGLVQTPAILALALNVICHMLSVAGCAVSVSGTYLDASARADRCELRPVSRELDASIGIGAEVDGSGICDPQGQSECLRRFENSVAGCVVVNGIARCMSANVCGFQDGRFLRCRCGEETCADDQLCVSRGISDGGTGLRCVQPCL